MNDRVYWAALPAREAISECENRRKEYYKHVNSKGYMYIWRLVNDFYYSATARGALSTAAGDWNELQDVEFNVFQNLIKHKVGIVINQRPTWDPMAQNSDPTTLAQTTLAKSILSYYTEIKGYDKKMERAATAAAKFGEAFVVQTWDASEGKLTAKLPSVDEMGNETVTNIFEGDLDCRVHEPIDVIRDCAIKEHDQNHWFIVRQTMNKWNLAAKHPEMYHEIISCTLDHVHDEHYLTYDADDEEAGKDLVYVYTLYHKKNAALPEGRVISYINEDIILSADPMSYQDFPVHRMIDTPISNTNFSTSDAFDMLQVADLLNGLWSTVVTNQRAFGVSNIIMPVGSNINASQLGGSLNIIEFDPLSGMKPEVLELLKTPAEIFNTIDRFTSMLNILSGVNSTAQGDPPPGVTSGVALSLMQSMNIQYNQGLQQNYIIIMSSVGTALINLTKQNATTERVVQIVGKAKASLAQTYTGKDLENVTRVVARPGNPMAQTVAGRIGLAELLLQNKLVDNPSMMLTVIETGSLDVLTEGAEVGNINIKAENEAMREGKTIPVFVTDDHLAHLREHAKISSDIHMRTAPAGSKEAEIMANVLQHMAEHTKILGDPTFAPLLMAIGQTPLQLAPGQVGYSAPPASAAPAGSTTNISLTTPQGTAPGSPQPPGANQAAAAVPPPKQPAPAGTPTGQFPAQLVNIAQRAPQGQL